MTNRSFYVADLTSTGEQQLLAEYAYPQLEQIPGAAELIVVLSTALWQAPEEFETPLSTKAYDIALRWRASSPTTGIATIRVAQQLASLSLLASGKDAQADHLTFQAFQLHLLRQLHDTGHEPSFALMDLKQRPLVATVNFVSPPDPAAQQIVALADRCFAAAYFRQQGLA